jgi:hypothetical protein
MKAFALLIATLFLVGGTVVAQSGSDWEEFEYNRRLVKQSHLVVPKEGLVPDPATAIAIAYAVSVPIYGKKNMDEEKPFRTELKNGVWMVLGTMQCKSCAGGTLVMEIDKQTGKILFATHTM